MKPVKFLAVLAAVLFSFNFSHAQSTSKIKIGVELEIGRPRHECTGFGVCKIKVVFDLRATAVGTAVNANLEYDSEAGVLTWTQSKSQVAENNPSKLDYFESGAVTFDEDVVLPADVNDALGSRSGITIKAGTYRVSYANDTYTIQLNNLKTSL